MDCKNSSNNNADITEDMIFSCFAAAQKLQDTRTSAESFLDVEEYENRVMYPEFARWARKAGYPHLSNLFLKVAGEEKEHAVWLRKLYSEIGIPQANADVVRAKEALAEIKANCDRLIALNPDGVVENALRVAIRVEQREHLEIYPRLRDQALQEGLADAAEIYQKVIDSESVHAQLFQEALNEFISLKQKAQEAVVQG